MRSTILLLGAGLFVGGSTATADESVDGYEGEEESSEEPTEESGEEATEDSTEEFGEESGEEVPAPPPLDADLSQAIEAPDLSVDQIRWLRPRRHLMDQVPRGQNDFTAYTLEFMEVEVGLANVMLGVLPRVQLGTVPALHLVGVPNVNAKVNAIRFGGLDVAGEWAYFGLGLEGFDAGYQALGLRASLQITTPWSIHGGVSWAQFSAEGPPASLTGLSSLLSTQSEEDIDAWLEDPDVQAGLEGGNISAQAEATMIRVATDFRFNRRDSLVLQFQTMLRGDAAADVVIPPILGLDEAFQASTSGSTSASEAYLASLSWHSAWNHWEMRIGVGVSSVDYAWILQAMDLSYRFGGATRRGEWRIRKTWRRNREDTQDLN